MREGLKPLLDQWHEFSAVLERIGVPKGDSLGITVLMRDVRLVATGEVVADHLWLPYGPWLDGVQVGTEIWFVAIVRRYVKGYTGDDPVRQAARPRTVDYGLELPERAFGRG